LTGYSERALPAGSRWGVRPRPLDFLAVTDHDLARVGRTRWDILVGANLQDDNLLRAELENAHLIGANLQGDNLNGAQLQDAFLDGTNLEGANLHGADLTGADLSRTDLTGANLHGATLTGAVWSNTTCPDGTNSSSDGWTCANNE
jgi:uncharacterized protein YjbI with pentapeptide repeats